MEARVEFTEHNLSGKPAVVMTTLKDVTGRRTVPQIFAGGKILGGADELAAAFRNDPQFLRRDDAIDLEPLPQRLQEIMDEVAVTAEVSVLRPDARVPCAGRHGDLSVMCAV